MLGATAKKCIHPGDRASGICPHLPSKRGTLDVAGWRILE